MIIAYNGIKLKGHYFTFVFKKNIIYKIDDDNISIINEESFKTICYGNIKTNNNFWKNNLYYNYNFSQK